MFDEDEMPVSHLFRTYSEMPRLEQLALDLCKGKVLDVGACAGCHTLHLQEKGFNVTAIDISPLSVETMKLRGIRQVMLADMFEDNIGNDYDTILLLMNGTSIAGTLDRLPLFLTNSKQCLRPTARYCLTPPTYGISMKMKTATSTTMAQNTTDKWTTACNTATPKADVSTASKLTPPPCRDAPPPLASTQKFWNKTTSTHIS